MLLAPLALLLGAVAPATAQRARFYSAESGLPNSLINSICQDSHGYIWITTENGLAYFDGMQFARFHHIHNEASSLGSDLVLKVFEDSRHTLWVGSSAAESGLQQFDYTTNSFRTISLASSSDIEAGMHVASIIESPDRKYLLIGTSGRGIQTIRMEDYSQDIDLGRRLTEMLPSPYVGSLYFDSRRRLWVSSADNGLSLIDFEQMQRIEIAWGGENASIQDLIVSGIAEDKQTGKIIIGTFNDGLWVYDEETRTLRRAASEQARKAYVCCLHYSENPTSPQYGGFFVGTENNGLQRFDIATESLSPVHFSNCAYDLQHGKVHSVFQDNQHNIWLGIYQKGVMVIPNPMYGFDYLSLHPDSNSHENIACATSIVQTPDHHLWVATDGSGIFVLHPDGSRSHYLQEEGLPNNCVMALLVDRHHTIWLSTYMGGIACWHKGTGFHRLTPPEGINLSKVMNMVYDGKNDRIYLGTNGEGVYVLDVATQQVKPLPTEGQVKWISSLHLDHAGLLWIGCYNGLRCFDPNINQLIHFDMEKTALTSRIYSIKEDERSGVLWIGSGNGLISFHRKSGKSQLYTEDDGLPDKVVNTIALAEEGHIWFSTCNGLSHFNPHTGEFHNYHAYDGLQSDEFRYGAVEHCRDGRIIFGGINGLTAFYPSMVEKDIHPVPPINFSHLKVLNYDADYDTGKLDKHISQATQLTLRNQENTFDLEMSVLEYSNPYKIVYAYRMEGFENDWNYTDADSRIATYTNLPTGSYTFHVKAFFDNQPANAAERKLKVRILPPWWNTWWARAVYLLLLIGLVRLGMLLYRRRQQRQLDLIAEEKKDLKLRLFTDFSHEIRTPLTLVIDPLRKLRAEDADENRTQLYNLIYRNTLRIQRLINQLLDIHKLDSAAFRLQYYKTDMIFFVRDIMYSFENAAKSKEIDFRLDCPCTELEAWIDQSNFDKVLFNILSNAFKFTPEHGHVTLRLAPCDNFRHSGIDSHIKQFLELRVENSGSQIAPEQIGHIFELFYQADNHDHAGSGIGLHLTKKLVELHHGSITVANLPDGVVFTVRIPLGNKHLEPDELLKSAKHRDLYTAPRSAAKPPQEAVEGLDYQPGNEEQNPGHTRKKRHTILLVDDDAEFCQYVRQQLADSYNVECFANGKEVLPAISTLNPDAVVTDLVMPQMGGLELCRKIKSNIATNHIPVLVLTSQNDDESKQRCVECGADRYLIKPISVDLLKSAITQAISTREIIRNKYRTPIEPDYEETMKSQENRLLNRVIEVIRNNIEKPDFSVDDLSREVGISRVHLNRKLKELISTSPSNLIKSIRLKQAAYLLIHNKVNILEVVYKVGFSTHSYFSSSFRSYFGMSPKEFVQKYKDCDEETLEKLFKD